MKQIAVLFGVLFGLATYWNYQYEKETKRRDEIYARVNKEHRKIDEWGMKERREIQDRINRLKEEYFKRHGKMPDETNF